jgi:MFS family permease
MPAHPHPGGSLPPGQLSPLTFRTNLSRSAPTYRRPAKQAGASLRFRVTTIARVTDPRVTAALPSRLATFLVFLASGAVLVLEIVGLRLIAPYVGVTLQTSTAVIGIALAAIAYGAWMGGWLADRVAPSRLIAPALLLGAAATALIPPVARWSGEYLRGSAAGGVVLLAGLILLPASALLSSITPMVVKLQLSDLGRTGSVVGRLSAVGTLGAITATFATGFVLVAIFPSTGIVFGLAAVLAAVGLGLGAYLSRRVTAVAAVVGLCGAGLSVAAPSPCDVETSYHCARVEADPGRPGGRTLWLNSARHSYVDLADPRHLEFEYTRTMGALVDVLGPAGAHLDTLHLGGGGLTLPGYLEATRPGSRSRVLEVDGGLLDLDARALRVPVGLERWVGDARVGVGREPSARWDLVIGDAFGHLTVPWHLTTRELVTDVRRVLRPDGVYALNVIDRAGGRFARAEAATFAAVFAHSAVVAQPDALAGRGPTVNYVLIGSAAPLPTDALRARLDLRNRGVILADARAFAGGARPLRDDFAPVDQMLAE